MKKGLLTAVFMGVAVAVGAQTQARPEVASDNPGNLDAAIVAQICKSPAPLLVIDTFKNRKADYGITYTGLPPDALDVDGDGIPDITHGEMVAKVAELSGKTVITYGMQPLSIIPNAIDLALDDVIKRLENGAMKKPSAIVMAMVILAHENGEDGLRTYVPSVKADTLARHKDAIIEGIGKRTGKASSVFRLHQKFQRLKKMGIPVISPAGNDYSRYYNFFGIAGGVSVGALTHDGRHIAAYSNQSSLTTLYRIGDFVGRKVQGGIDINNDGKPDFPDKVLSGGKSIARTFNGTAANIHPLDHKGEGGFYDYKEYKIQNGEIARDKIPGSLTVNGDYVHLPDAMRFFIENGKWKYDPARDGDPNQVSLIGGTSYANSNICSPPPESFKSRNP